MDRIAISQFLYAEMKKQNKTYESFSKVKLDKSRMSRIITSNANVTLKKFLGILDILDLEIQIVPKNAKQNL